MADQIRRGGQQPEIPLQFTVDRPAALLLWLGYVTCLSLFLIFIATTNVNNYFPVSADDAWIMSASSKLASEGVFGSDLYTGFYNADTRYFIALPVHHLLQALSFSLFGMGVTQARLPGLLGAVLLIWIVAVLAWRNGDWRSGLLAPALVVLWRSNLVATEPRPPLLAYAHSGRYDVTATALVWLTVLLLDTYLRRPQRLLALSVGVCAGLCTLTQFFGGFVAPLVGTAWIWQWGRSGLRRAETYLVAGGFLSVILPYGAYVLVALDDFQGQAALKGARANFDQLSFYLNNLGREGDRYLWLFQGQWQALTDAFELQVLGGPWLLFALPLAMVYLVWRTRAARAPVVHLPWLALLIFASCLALFDQTKAPVYSILLVPGLSLILALAAGAGLAWKPNLVGHRLVRLLLVGSILLALSITLLEGLDGYLRQREIALGVSTYHEVADEIEAALPPEASILAAERWWPALRHYPYLALNNLWTQWRVQNESGDSVSFGSQVVAVQANVLIVNNNVRGDIRGYPERLRRQFWSFLVKCGMLAADWQDDTYGWIEVYHLKRGCA